MSMTETPVAPNSRPKKRKPARRKRSPAAPKPVAAFAGLTATDCPTTCGVAGCIISGKPYCGHPYKGGLQGADMQNSAAVSRVEAAKAALGKRKVQVGKL